MTVCSASARPRLIPAGSEGPKRSQHDEDEDEDEEDEEEEDEDEESQLTLAVVGQPFSLAPRSSRSSAPAAFSTDMAESS